MFSGRKEELSILRKKYSSKRLEVISVLGKRRIGKSQLISESAKTFDGIVLSYECYDASEKANIDKISYLIRNAFHNEYLNFNSIYEIVLFLHDEAKKQKILFVLDEYPYMRDGEKTDSELKNAIDKINELDNQNPLKIVICGSQIDIMNILDNADKPLHGRFTERIELKQLNYLESATFYPNATLEDKTNYYCVLGGVPYFLKQIDDTASFDDNIIRLFFSSHPLLKSELETQISSEIAKIEKAPFVLDIIGTKTISYNDILQKFNNSYPNANIDYALKKMIEVNVVEKIAIKQNNGAIKPYYRIKDNALRFYYSYLNYQFANKLLFKDEEYYSLFIEDDLKHQFIPHNFEKVGFEFISLMNKQKKLPFVLLDLFPYIINDRVGKQSYQFDVVGKTNDGLINFECKYLDNPVHKEEIYEEKRQTELADSSFIDTIFISKSPVLGKCKAYYLKDLFDDKLLK